MSSESDDSLFVSCKWLREHLNDRSLIIADCRYNLADFELGRKEYLEGHIPGAYQIDMEKDLTGRITLHGGRHPLPDQDIFAKRMNSIGLNPEITVIAYDSDGSGAARFWWLLNYFGHSKVRIMNGGIVEWKSLGFELTTEIPPFRSGSFSPVVNKTILASVEDVKSIKPTTTLIDSRTKVRYAGISEPIDKIAGHIPGAVNYQYTDTVSETGLFRNRKELLRMFRDIGRDVIVYCGSGVTACVNFVALTEAGFKPKLYAGSWSDWISYKENPISTGVSP